ncbi:MAG: SufB/SufD family protein [Cyanobium sp.]
MDSLESSASAAIPAESAELSVARGQARRRLREQPLPSRRQEDWRFTDPSALAAIRPQRLAGEAPAGVDEAVAALAPVVAGTMRLQLDGASDPLAGAMLPPGLEPIAEGEWHRWLNPEDPGDAAAGTASPWTGLIAAAAGPVLALRVRAGLEMVLELVSEAGCAEGVLAQQLLLVLEPGARLELVQVHRAAGASLTAVRAVIHLGEGASLRQGLIAQGAEPAALLADLAVIQQPGSELVFASAVSGWALSRLEPRVVQAAGGASTRLRSLQRCDQRQVADQHSSVRFEGPEGRLDQLHKAIAAGAGRSVFNGAVAVPRAAQRTDAAQLSRGLLLSDRARIDSKPQLEIVADDVKCAHGATVSRLQEDELFYLRSRGISEAMAGSLLLRGYCAEVLAELPAAAALWQPLAFLLGEEAPTP